MAAHFLVFVTPATAHSFGVTVKRSEAGTGDINAGGLFVRVTCAVPGMPLIFIIAARGPRSSN